MTSWSRSIPSNPTWSCPMSPSRTKAGSRRCASSTSTIPRSGCSAGPRTRHRSMRANSSAPALGRLRHEGHTDARDHPCHYTGCAGTTYICKEMDPAERAPDLLAHADTETMRRVYRCRPERVRLARRYRTTRVLSDSVSARYRQNCCEWRARRDSNSRPPWFVASPVVDRLPVTEQLVATLELGHGLSQTAAIEQGVTKNKLLL